MILVKGNRALRLVATLVVVAILVLSFSLVAFAGGSVFNIPEGTKIVTKGMVPDDATVVNVPSSVVTFESGAFSNCKDLEMVNINNASGSVIYDASAFHNSSITINYMQSPEEETEIVTDATPFASAKGQLSGVDIWGKLVDNAGSSDTGSQPSSTFINAIVYVVTGAVIIGAVALVISKFKDDKNSA